MRNSRRSREAMSELKFRDGVPCYDGTAELFEKYKREALLFAETLEWRKRETAAPRLIAALEGPARLAAQQKPSSWFSNPKGVYQLLDVLKTTMKSPTLPEAGRYISRFFFNLKRRKGETMAAWLVRHEDTLDDAKRALSEAIREYGPKAGLPRHSPLLRGGFRRSEDGDASRESYRSRNLARDTIYDERGRMVEEEEEESSQVPEEGDVPWWQSHGYNSWWHNAWGSDHGSWWSSSKEQGGHWSEYQDEATIQAEHFLPDFVIAWMLLQCSGLDQHEKGALIANLKNEFTQRR